MNLITNRTLADVSRYQYLKDKSFDNMTAEERTEWLTSLRGAYNYTDLNRVEEAVVYVANRIKEHGYSVSVGTKRTWAVTDCPTASDLTEYLDKVKAIREALGVLRSTPNVPESMAHFTYKEANAIEQILFDVDYMITEMMKAWFYSNDVYAGEV